MNLLEQSIGKIARDVSGSTSVFHKYGLDFCCAGSKTLRVMIEEKGINTNQILSELYSVLEQSEPASNWNNAPNDTLVAHIKNHYHDAHRTQLPELIRLSKRVEEVHGNHAQCPIGLTEHLKKLREELEIHMKTEEENFFPLIMRGEISTAYNLIEDLQEEHETHGTFLEIIEKITNNIKAPKGACNTWQALYTGLQTFKIDLMQHIHLENNVLFDGIKMKTKTLKLT